MKEKIPISLISSINTLKEKNKDIVLFTSDDKSLYKFIDATKESDFYFSIVNFRNEKGKLMLHLSFCPKDLEFYEEVIRWVDISQLERDYNSWIVRLKQFHNLQIPQPNIVIDKNAKIAIPNYQKLQINSLKLFTEFKIELKNNINIILGKNAFGKTSILQALALVNIPDENLDTKPISFENFIKIGQKEATISHTFGQKHRNIKINQINVKTDNGGKSERLPIIFVYGVNTFTKYNNMNYKEIIDKLILGNEDKWYHTNSIFQDFSDGFYDPSIVLNSIDIYHKTEEAKAIKDLIVTKLNNLLPENLQISTDDNLSYYFKDLQGNQLKTEQLSEGYRDNIILLTDIFIRIISLRNNFPNYTKETPIQDIFDIATGLIAIDEFDRHLHPSWQKVYLTNMAKVFPNIKFVLTTHNPLSIMDREGSEIQELVMDNDGFVKAQPFTNGTKRIDISTVLLVYFGIDSVLSPELQQDVDKFYQLRGKDNITEQEANEIEKLSNSLNNSFVGANVHDYRFLLFLKFLKEKGFDTSERLREISISEEEADILLAQFEEENV